MNDTLSASEQALVDRERELAEVQRIAKVGGVVVDLTAGFRNHRSPEYLAIHGLPPEAVNETHEDWVRRLHPEDRERAERQFLDLIKGTSDRYSAEYRIIRPDGELYIPWYRANYKPFWTWNPTTAHLKYLFGETTFGQR